MGIDNIEALMPETWYTCPICGKQFSLKILLMGHMRSHQK